MSSDQKFQLNLPEIRVKLGARSSSEVSNEDDRAITRGSSEVSNRDGGETRLANGDDDEECRTPTSEEHKIPQPLTCPPPPRKPSSAVWRKRKLSELLDATAQNDVESFLGSRLLELIELLEAMAQNDLQSFLGSSFDLAYIQRSRKKKKQKLAAEEERKRSKSE